MKAEIDGGNLTINLIDVFMGLDEESRRAFLETYTIEEILTTIERQLKHETDLYWWSTSGARDGAVLREAILKIQGLEPEFKKDLESKIRALEHDVANYKKYYDWYYRVYHLKNLDGDSRIIDRLHQAVGNPATQEAL
jgi:hypothetical protein